MSTSYSPGWIHGFLSNHLTIEELKKVEPFLFAESWASPSALNRFWIHKEEEFPLRFHLEIDMKI